MSETKDIADNKLEELFHVEHIDLSEICIHVVELRSCGW